MNSIYAKNKSCVEREVSNEGEFEILYAFKMFYGKR